MKYTRLTKEQLEEMHAEFATFLATQQITAAEWATIKEDTPEVAEQEIDVFSDLVWEKVLQKVAFADKVEAQSLFLFAFTETAMQLVAIRINKPEVDLTTEAGLQWLFANYKNEAVTIYNAKKAYTDDRLLDIFKIIEQGAQITDGAAYNYFIELL